MALRMVSRRWLLDCRARSAEPNRRLIIEFTVSTCHLCPYFRLYRPNRCFIRRRQRPDGSLSVGLPRVAGMIVRMPCDLTLPWTHSASKSASAKCVSIRARRAACPSAAPNCTRSEPGPQPGTAAKIMWLLQSTTKTTFGYLA